MGRSTSSSPGLTTSNNPTTSTDARTASGSRDPLIYIYIVLFFFFFFSSSWGFLSFLITSNETLLAAILTCFNLGLFSPLGLLLSF
jgi:hypothetical protein